MLWGFMRSIEKDRSVETHGLGLYGEIAERKNSRSRHLKDVTRHAVCASPIVSLLLLEKKDEQ